MTHQACGVWVSARLHGDEFQLIAVSKNIANNQGVTYKALVRLTPQAQISVRYLQVPAGEGRSMLADHVSGYPQLLVAYRQAHLVHLNSIHRLSFDDGNRSGVCARRNLRLHGGQPVERAPLYLS